MGLEYLAGTALNLITKYGKTIYINRVKDVSYNVATGRAEASESKQAFTAIVSDYKGRELSNQGIQIGDKKIIAAASGFAEPLIGDQIIVDSEQFSVVAVRKSYASSVVAVYEIQGRAT